MTPTTSLVFSHVCGPHSRLIVVDPSLICGLLSTLSLLSCVICGPLSHLIKLPFHLWTPLNHLNPLSILSVDPSFIKLLLNPLDSLIICGTLSHQWTSSSVTPHNSLISSVDKSATPLNPLVSPVSH